jgi:hypothetical protein
MALVPPVVHRRSCSNETVQNAPKHEFWVQWRGFGALVAKNFDATDVYPLGFVPDLSMRGVE